MMIRKSQFLFWLLLLFPLVGTAVEQRPNVLFIYTDDQDFSEVGAYGGKVYTPHTDALADRGLRLDRFYVTSSVCTPSRFSALSGCYASRSQVLADKVKPDSIPRIAWNTYLKPGRINLPKILKAEGYRTGMVGKWHLSHFDWSDRLGKNEDPSKPAVAKRIRQNYRGQQEEMKSFGFDVVEAFYENNIGHLNVPKSLRSYNEDWKALKAIEFIEASGDQPFFLYYASSSPHCYTQQAHEGEWAVNLFEMDTRSTPSGWLTEPITVIENRDTLLPTVRRKGYHDRTILVTWMDAAIGAVLKSLEASGKLENTIIIVASDHQAIGKNSLNGSPRAPFVIAGPGIPRGVNNALVANIDLLPTILGLCGIEPPGGLSLDGEDFSRVLRENLPRARDALMLEVAYSRGVITHDNWKYIAHRYDGINAREVKPKITSYPDGVENLRFWRSHKYSSDHFPHFRHLDQLYNLEADPGEKRNLVDKPQGARKLEEMRALLSGYIQTTPYPFGEFSE